MHRRSFLKNCTIATAATAAATAPTILKAAPNKLRWRLALAVPKTTPVWGDGVVRFAKNVKEMSDSELDIKVYGAGELVPAFGIFDAVKSGSIQLGHGSPYYYQGKVPESPFFASMPFGMDSNAHRAWLIDGDGQKLWDELMKPHGLKSITCGGTGYQSMGWFNKEINTAEDLKGLKIRIPGLASKIYAKAGASPVLLPGAEIFTSLSTGVIDAVEWVGPYADYVMGFQKVAKNFYIGSWHEVNSTLEILLNLKEWESLSERLRKIIEIAAMETDLWMRATYSSKNGEYLEKIKSEGKVNVREIPVEVLKALKGFGDEAYKELESSSEISHKISNSYLSFKKTYEGFTDMTERSYAKAFKL